MKNKINLKKNINIILFKKILNIIKQTTSIRNKIFFQKNIKLISFFENMHTYIYKGNKFRILKINKFNLQLRLGHFIFTRKPFKFFIKTKINTKTIKR